MIERVVSTRITERFFKGKAIILTGARQTGKTTLAHRIIGQSSADRKAVVFNCDNPTDRDLLNNRDLAFLQKLVGEADLIFIDEGQKVETIGQTVKLLVDHYKKEKQVLVTGSSRLGLLEGTSEHLTGRIFEFGLYPLSLEELYPDRDLAALLKDLPDRLVFGTYPEVALEPSFNLKRELVTNLHASYLYKDVLAYATIRHSTIVSKLVKALALQIGSEVSYHELANVVGISQKTVEHYIDVLEKSHVIFRLPPYTGNKRREISKMKKIYFHDLGIRNAVINNFNFPDSRNDTGALWENFVIAERLRYRHYHGIFANQHFWRTYDGSEVDLVEEREGKLYGYECKWRKKKKDRRPATWLAYPGSSHTVISPEEVKGFIL